MAKKPRTQAKEIIDMPFRMEDAINGLGPKGSRKAGILTAKDMQHLFSEKFEDTEALSDFFEAVSGKTHSAADLSDRLIRGICDDWRTALEKSMGMRILDLLHTGLRAHTQGAETTLRAIAAVDFDRLSTRKKVDIILKRQLLNVPLPVMRSEVIRELIGYVVDSYCDDHKIKDAGDRALIEVHVMKLLRIPIDDSTETKSE